MSDKLIEITDLHVSYKTAGDDVLAVRGLNLTVGAGQSTGITAQDEAVSLGWEKTRPTRRSVIIELLLQLIGGRDNRAPKQCSSSCSKRANSWSRSWLLQRGQDSVATHCRL
jgi:hypothetical protein